MDTATLESEALKLPETERAILLDRLLESLSASKITHFAEQTEEAHERYAAYKRGEIGSVDGKGVVSELKSRLKN